MIGKAMFHYEITKLGEGGVGSDLITAETHLSKNPRGFFERRSSDRTSLPVTGIPGPATPHWMKLKRPTKAARLY